MGQHQIKPVTPEEDKTSFSNLFSLAWNLDLQTVLDKWSEEFNFVINPRTGRLRVHMFKHLACVACKYDSFAYLYFVNRQDGSFVHSMDLGNLQEDPDKLNRWKWSFCENQIVLFDYYVPGVIQTGGSLVSLDDFRIRTICNVKHVPTPYIHYNIGIEPPMFYTPKFLYYVNTDRYVDCLDISGQSDEVSKEKYGTNQLSKVEFVWGLKGGVIYADERWLIVFGASRSSLKRYDLKHSTFLEKKVDDTYGEYLYWNGMIYLYSNRGKDITRISVETFEEELYCSDVTGNENRLSPNMRIPQQIPYAIYYSFTSKCHFCEWNGQSFEMFPGDDEKSFDVHGDSNSLILKRKNLIQCFYAPLDIGILKLIRQKCTNAFDIRVIFE